MTDRSVFINDDCFNVLPAIADGSIDMILTDPPYGIDYSTHRPTVAKHDKIANDKNLDWLDDFVKEAYRVLKDNSAIYCFCSWHNVDIFKQAIEKYFNIKNIIVWVKNNHGTGDITGSYAPRHEFCIFAHKGRVLMGEHRWPDVMQSARTDNKYHPTQKPVDLLERFINNSSKEGDTILDCFMGAGSTGIACVYTRREFIGIEINRQYFETATKRILAANNDIRNKQISLFDELGGEA